MNTKTKLMFAPLFTIAFAIGTLGAAHAGTLTLSGFSSQRVPHVLLQAEQIMFSGRLGHIRATCGTKPLAISQTQPLYKVNMQLARECPANLSVVMSSHAAPSFKNAAILKHP